MRGSKHLAPIVALAMAVAAVAASPAAATRVTPAGTAVTASLKASTFLRIDPANAYSKFNVACLGSGATIVTPPENETQDNMNRGPEPPYEEGGAVGTYSEGPGTVHMAISSGPTLGECGLYQASEEKPEELGQLIVSASTEVLSGWSMDGFAPNLPEEELAEEGAALIAFPKEAVKINFAGCQAILAPNGPDAVFAEYDNANHVLEVDGQVEIKYSGGFLCPAFASPVQVEAEYALSNEMKIGW